MKEKVYPICQKCNKTCKLKGLGTMEWCPKFEEKKGTEQTGPR